MNEPHAHPIKTTRKFYYGHLRREAMTFLVFYLILSLLRLPTAGDWRIPSNSHFCSPARNFMRRCKNDKKTVPFRSNWDWWTFIVFTRRTKTIIQLIVIFLPSPLACLISVYCERRLIFSGGNAAQFSNDGVEPVGMRLGQVNRLLHIELGWLGLV